MKSFSYSTLPSSAYSEECWNLQTLLHESKGRFDAVRSAHTDLLQRLERQALFDNVDASARIEGICIDPRRASDLIGGETPLTSHEQQIVGYARTLKAFQQEPERFDIAASTFLAMHTVLLGGAPAGKKSAYRQKDYVNMMINGQVQRVPASPIAAFETPLYLGSACDNLAQAWSATASRQLLLIPSFAVDFMCIKPFDEGTGRLARLFSLLLMQKAGFDIFRYMSIDRLCEKNAAAYYDALNACLVTWDSETCDYTPFVHLWLSLVHEAYNTVLRRAETSSQSAPSKSQRVADFFAFRSGPFTKQEVMQALPDISLSTVENSLGVLVKEGFLEKLGRGRATAYRRRA